MPDVGGIAGARLKSFIERIERLHEERNALAEDLKEVYAEARGTGFDVKIMKKLVDIRRKDQSDLDEEETLLDVYKRALGMIPDFPSDEPDETRAGAPARVPEARADVNGPRRRMWDHYAAIFEVLQDEGTIPRTDRSKTVYFVHAPAAGVVKIGVSEDIRKRLISLATASPVSLTLLGTVPGGKVREMELHTQFAAMRVKGEWFEATDALLNIIGMLIYDEKRAPVAATVALKQAVHETLIDAGMVETAPGEYRHGAALPVGDVEPF